MTRGIRSLEDHFQAVFETAGDAIVLVAPDGEILELNREAEKVYGCDLKSVAGKNYYDLFVPDDRRAAVVAGAERVLAGTPTRGFVSPVKGADGSTRFLSWNVDRLLDAAGKPVGLVACGHDVTERKELEDAVLRIARGVTSATGREFFRDLVQVLADLLQADIVSVGELIDGESSKIRTVAHSVDGVIVSNISYDLEGTPCEHVVGKRLCTYLHGVSELFPADAVVVEAGIEGYVGAPLSDSHGRPLGTIVVLYRQPIPKPKLTESVLQIFATRASTELERKRSEEELAVSEALNRKIVESMPAGVIRFGLDGSVLHANDTALQILGLTWDVLRDRGARGWQGILRWEDGTECEPSDFSVVKCLMTNEPQPPQVLGVLRPGGSVAYAIFTAVPGPECAIVMFVDITERKRVEHERRRLEAQVQHAQKLESLGVLAGGIAHDFNNLLTGILGNVSLALMKLPEGGDVNENLTRVERAAERAAELTNQMLAYAGKSTFDVRALSLNEIIREFVPLLGTSLSKMANLEHDLDAGILDIEADRSQIEQVLLNLVTNASDAIDEKPGTIRIRTGGGDSGVFLEVSDDGSGMDAETRARIFDPFFTTKFTGRGLGLAAVEGIVRSHRGSIRVDSRPGEGTSFKIVFPAARPSLSERAAQKRERGSAAQAAGTILVVDDEESVREVAKDVLESAGYRVILARDGIEAVEQFRQAATEIVGILVDVSMPRMSGEETLEKILAVRSDARVLLTSGYTEQDARERFRDRSFLGFIQKPFRASELIEKIQELAS